MPRPPKAKTATKDLTGNFAWVQHCIRRSLGEGGHLAPQTALRDSASLQNEATPQVLSKAKDNFRKDDDVCWHKGETDSNSKRSWR